MRDDKWVYRFGGGEAEGTRRHARPARRQGRQPRRDEQSRPAGAAGLHHHDRGLHAISTPTAEPIRPSSKAQVAAGAGARSSELSARRFGDAAKPLLVSVRSGARVSMPGMMDTVLNLGLNDGTVEGLAERSRRRALRLRQLPPLHPDVRRRRARRRAPPFRGAARAPQGGPRRSRSTPSSTPRTGRSWSQAYKAMVQERARQAVPAGSAGAALGRDRRGVRLAG